MLFYETELFSYFYPQFILYEQKIDLKKKLFNLKMYSIVILPF